MKSLKLAVFAALVAVSGCDEVLNLAFQDLQGTWTATTYRFAENASPSNTVDLIQRDGASFSLTVEADGAATTVFDDGLSGSSLDSGSLDGTSTTLTLGDSSFRALRSGDVLTLTDVSTSFDFGTGSAPATLVIVLRAQ